MGNCSGYEEDNFLFLLDETDTDNPLVKLNCFYRINIPITKIYKIKFIHHRPNRLWTLSFKNQEEYTLNFSDIDNNRFSREKYQKIFNWMINICNMYNVKTEFQGKSEDRFMIT